jgi:hypothetical protein
MKSSLFSILASIVMIVASSGSRQETSTAPRAAQEKPQSRLRLENTMFEFPGAGKHNNNGTIGDFCCTGETATIRTAQGTPIGFIYFYGFSGGINLKSGAAADQLSVLVSGISNPARPNAGSISRVKSSVEFSANEMKPGFSRQVSAGALQFTVTIVDAQFIDEAHSRFRMDSVKLKVDVQEAPAT